jgi:hypothetical protein
MDNGDLSVTYHISNVCLVGMFALGISRFWKKKNLKNNVEYKYSVLSFFQKSKSNFSEL